MRVNAPASALHPLAFDSSGAVEVGDPAYALGNPFGLDRTLTAGIISAVGRDIQDPNGLTIANDVQTDAAINHGNSGGPLIDVATNTVIGINDQIESDSNDNAGVGFAVPIDAAKTVESTLIDGGTVRHSYLGVTVADAANGAVARIGCVVSGAPADSAGPPGATAIRAAPRPCGSACGRCWPCWRAAW